LSKCNIVRQLVMLLLLGLLAFAGLVRGEGVGYIQIYDFIPQNKTQTMDPALVLQEEKSLNIFEKQDRIVYDLYNVDYMQNYKMDAINASTYKLTFERHEAEAVVYVHAFAKDLILGPGENAAIFVDEAEDNTLVGSICHTGVTPIPGLDEAVVQLCPTDSERFSNLSKFTIVGTNTRCIDCKGDIDMKATVVKDSLQFLVDDAQNWPWDITISYNEQLVCSQTFVFGDGGVYNLHVKESERAAGADQVVYECYMSVMEPASDYWMPIWLPILIIVIICIVIVLICMMDRNFPRLREEFLKGGLFGRFGREPTEKKEEKPSTRLNSLDTFRGIAITTMIFVNYGGGKYYFIEHAAWHGTGLADYVFPWFMFMVGTSIALSVQSQLKKNIPKAEILKKVTVRFIKLFLIGVFLNTGVPGGVELSNWRIPGVLQRIGFTYFVCSVLEVLFIPKLQNVDTYGGERMSQAVDANDYNEYNKDSEKGKFLNDNEIPEKKISNSWRFGHSSNGEPACTGRSLLFHTWPQWIIMALFTGLWCAVTFAMPIPGCPTGYTGAGGLADNGSYPNCTGGAAGYIDRLIFGPTMYQHPTCKKLYKTTQAYDPEGLLGSLMGIVTVYTGVLAGHIVVTNKSSRAGTLVKLLVLTAVSLVLGIVLSKGSFTGGWVPINKNLWTPSFVMLTSATSYGVLAVCYFLIDFQKWCCGSPFRSAGKNPLFLYVGSYIFYNYFPFNWATSESHGPLMAQAIVGTFMWLLVGLYLDAKKIYYKI